MAREGLTRTVSYTHAVCRTALNAAVDWGLNPRNPVLKAQAPQQTHRPIEPLTAEKTRTFLQHIDRHRSPLKGALVFPGPDRRPSREALGLHWGDIDWERGRFTIHRAYIKVKGRAVLRDKPKNKSSHRTIDLSPDLVAILRTHRDTQQIERQAAGDRWEDPRPWVFTTRHTGAGVRPDNALPTFKRLLKKAGLPRTTRIHDLRHGMATFWLASGVPVKVVSERLGHSNIGITLQTYGHAIPGMQADAAARLDAALLDFSQSPHQQFINTNVPNLLNSPAPDARREQKKSHEDTS